jgi:hypothetical protein
MMETLPPTGNPKAPILDLSGERKVVHHSDGFKNTVITPLGKTLRDEFAMAATEVDIASWKSKIEWSDDGHWVGGSREAARYAFADAMLAERQK